MITKTGELKTGVSVCDFCSEKAAYIDSDGHTYCESCWSKLKVASTKSLSEAELMPFKSVRITDNYLTGE